MVGVVVAVGAAFAGGIAQAQGVVVCEEPQAAQVGAQVLEEGGNAVDAAVATAFALAVTHPAAGNIGGGGFLLMRGAGGGEEAFVDFRETAPTAARPETYADRALLPSRERKGFVWAGVPGSVAGLALAHERWGSLPWQRLVRPAERLARRGFPLSSVQARSLNAMSTRWANSAARQQFRPPTGGSWLAGQRLVQADLARTLEQVGRRGADGFYRGGVARRLAAGMAAGGGRVTEDDLAGYRAVALEPFRFAFRGRTVLSAPLPSSGGATMAIALALMERWGACEEGSLDDLATVHAWVEALRRAYRERAATMGDPDHMAPDFRPLDPARLDALAATFDPDRATTSLTLAGGIAIAAEGDHTTHLSVIDAAGNAVSLTTTIEQSYGSRAVAPGLGFLLNNEMGDFNLRPGWTDAEGRIGTDPNLIAPGKRMLSSMTPTIVLAADGGVELILGSPGGRTIISTVAQILIDTLAYQSDPADAMARGRLYHLWLPDQVRMEEGRWPEAVVDGLRARGHALATRRSQGVVHMIAVDQATGARRGLADRRGSGASATAPR